MFRFAAGIVSVSALLTAGSARGLEYQVPASTASIATHDGTQIVFDVYGSGETAIVFVHGFSCNRNQWRAQIDAFASDYTLVLIDLPGHGDSGDDREDWSTDNFAKDVQTVADHLELERMVLIGHSMGGPVVAMAAALMPERVVGVVPVDALHDVEFEYPEGGTERLAAQMREDFDAFITAFVGGMLNPTISEELRTSLIADSQNNDVDAASSIFEQFGTISQSDILGNCPVPVHCINAAGFETKIETNRKYNEGFEATIIQDSGHWPMLEQPEAFNNVLRDVLDGWLGESE